MGGCGRSGEDRRLDGGLSIWPEMPRELDMPRTNPFGWSECAETRWRGLTTDAFGKSSRDGGAWLGWMHGRGMKRPSLRKPRD
jgi:hypothetical protein